MGIIAAVGDSVDDLKIGTPAAVMTFGSYAEFMMVYYLKIFVLNALQGWCYDYYYYNNNNNNYYSIQLL